MKCSKCNNELRKTEVKVYGAKNKVISYQCPKCDYFEFERETPKKVIEELRGELNLFPKLFNFFFRI